MRVYEAIFNENETDGVFGISLVENPAMEDEWITLSKHPQEIEFSAVDDKKNILMGAVLIPNKRVYRNMNGNEFEMKFSEDTIERLAHNFQRQSYQNNSSHEHEIALSDVTFVETWTVKDPQNDKSNAYGKVYPPGTWVTMAKVSDENYEKAKKGEIKGFSIDAILQLNEVKFKKDEKMSLETKSIIDAIKEGFKAMLSKAPEVVEPQTEEPVVAAETEGEVIETFDATDFLNDLKEVMAEFSKDVDAKIEAVKVEFSKSKEALEKENETLKTELSKQPEAAPVKNRGEVNVELTKEGKILELLRRAK